MRKPNILIETETQNMHTWHQEGLPCILQKLPRMRYNAFSMSSPSKATLQGTGQCLLLAKTHVGRAIWENSIVFPLKLKIRSYNPRVLPVVSIQGIEVRIVKSHVHSTSLQHFPQRPPWKQSLCPAWAKKLYTFTMEFYSFPQGMEAYHL